MRKEAVTGNTYRATRNAHPETRNPKHETKKQDAGKLEGWEA
jgi:hypothetical protein